LRLALLLEGHLLRRVLPLLERLLVVRGGAAADTSLDKRQHGTIKRGE